MIVPTFCTGKPAFAKRPVSQHRDAATDTGCDHLTLWRFLVTAWRSWGVKYKTVSHSRFEYTASLTKTSNTSKKWTTIHSCVFIFELTCFCMVHCILHCCDYGVKPNSKLCFKCAAINNHFFWFIWCLTNLVFFHCRQSYMSQLEKHINNSDNGWSPAWHSLCTWWLTAGAFWDT